MSAPFLDAEWDQLCQRLEQIANRLCQGSAEKNRFRQELRDFQQQIAPESYQGLSDCVRQGAALANRWRNESKRHVHDEALIDEAGDESFPASDPPVFNPSHA